MFGPTKRQLQKQYDRLTSDYRGEVVARRAAEDIVDAAAHDLATLQARYDLLQDLSLEGISLQSQQALEKIYEGIAFLEALGATESRLMEIVAIYLYEGEKAEIVASLKDGIGVVVPE